MARLAGFPPETYTALERVSETSLLRFDSLFTPERKIWVLPTIRGFHTHFVEGFDDGEGDFLEKFGTQLRGADADVIQFAAELLYVQQFFTSLTGADKKIRNVEAVLEWASGRRIEIPAWATGGLSKGLAGDQSFNQHRPFHLAWLSDFLLAWHGLDEGARTERLADPWRFREFVHEVKPTHKAFQPMREAWLYLIFPDTFENISSRKDKKGIRDAFSGELKLSLSGDLDRDLLEIRSQLTPEAGEGFSFYKPPLVDRWKSDPDQPGPTVTRESLLQAMALFDREQRHLAEWTGWESNGNYKFAAVHAGRRYPPKQVLSLASGKDKSSFSGGEATNKYFTKAGFSVEELPHTPPPLTGLSSALTNVLEQYAVARASGPYSKDQPVVGQFRHAQSALRNAAPVARRPTLSVEFSAGKGNWAAVPWIALLDSRETQTTQDGRYVVFLFRSDCSGVYLTLNQGVTAPIREQGRVDGLQRVRDRASGMRRQVGFLGPLGYALDDSIQLQPEGLGKDYEASTVAHKFYPAGAIPADDVLERDLESVLRAYDLVLEASSSAWIFQCNPETFDLSSALETLSEMSWTVTRHASEIAVGDRVYLWESGKNAGILASATVATPVAEREEDEASRVFWRKPVELKAAPRVSLRIDRVLDEKIAKSRLVNDPRFSDLALLKAPMGTNFPITEAHRRVLEEMFATPLLDPDDLCTSFSKALKASGLSFGDEHDSLVRCFVASLLTKPFVLLTGLSGSGKTQLALKLGEWIGAGRYRIVPVRPDWTGPESLLGYEDALLPPLGDRRAWHVPDALQLMLQAVRDPERPYVLILDEMNLAHVERYFADVLSGVESRETVLPNLEKGVDGYWRVPTGGAQKVQMPRNLILMGTVNVDETTYMFSPKVLDRANTIEFRVPTSALSADLSSIVRPVRCQQATDVEAASLLRIALDDGWHTANSPQSLGDIAALVRSVHQGLVGHGFEFGHRTYYESLRMASILHGCGVEDTDAIVDVFILQKILPRLHGSRRKLEPVLKMLAAFAFDPRASASASAAFDVLADKLDRQPAMPRTVAKLRRMAKALHANQFASFSD